MKTIKNSIIKQALELGFDFEQFNEMETLQDVAYSLGVFFTDNCDKLETIIDECEVTNNRNGQHVQYGNFESWGEIVDFSLNWHKSPETKVFHSSFVLEVSGIMKHIELYYLVGETEYNVPDGYIYSERAGKHIKLTYDVVFNDDTASNEKCMAVSKEDAIGYIETYNGTNHSYFNDYKGGTVSVVCNETGENVYEVEVF